MKKIILIFKRMEEGKLGKTIFFKFVAGEKKNDRPLPGEKKYFDRSMFNKQTMMNQAIFFSPKPPKMG